MKNYIYIGPVIKGTRLQKYAMFIDEIPEEYTKNNVLKRLFVTSDKLSEAMKDVKTKGTMLNTFYEQARNLKRSEI